MMKILINKNTVALNINPTGFKNLSGLIIVSFLFVSKLLFSQGLIEVPLTTNKVLIQKWHESQMQTKLPQRSSSIADTIKLDLVKGFLDDFSYDGPYPDSALWLDSTVYINRGYPISPVTIGVATFDGLNAKGYPYDFNATLSSSAPADYLTSKPIDLNYPASDSIYLSFYYQPQGRGNAPEKPDSLVLEFLAHDSITWNHIWSKAGSTLATGDSSWKLVMIPITNAIYLKKGFQFRFRNYATLSGSWDQWSIDYVYLNRFRKNPETVVHAVSFVYDAPSLIKTYSAMPWNHYNPTFKKDSITILARNNDTVPVNTTFYHNIYNQTGLLYSSLSHTDVIDPFVKIKGYYKYRSEIPALTATSNPTKYTFEALVKKGLNTFDTIHNMHTQSFSNFYSYDDGTAEEAFALAGTVGALLAEQYTSTIPDTLRCIDIYFNPQGTDATLYTFRLKVWNDNGGKPGTAIYTSDTVSVPAYNQGGYDQFTRYFLRAPLVLGAGTFYIGFQQNTDKMLGVGVDLNSNTQDKIFYNVLGTWDNADKPGSLMMHPVFGTAAEVLLGIENYTVKQNNFIIIYPNPANDKLFIKSNSLNTSQKIIYTVTDLFGRTILENTTTTSEYIDISSLSAGVYFIRTIDGGQIATNKFIKVK